MTPHRSLYTSSVPEGRAANHPDCVVTFRPPIGAPLPGAVVSLAMIGSPASSLAVTSSGWRWARAAFSSRCGGRVHPGVRGVAEPLNQGAVALARSFPRRCHDFRRQ